jgi:hypothetical protein
MSTFFRKGIAAGDKSQASAITLTLAGTVSVTVAALTAASEADVDVTVTGAQVGDLVQIAPRDAAAETGLMTCAWVSAANTVTVRMTNASGSTLTGSTSNWDYILLSTAAQTASAN